MPPRDSTIAVVTRLKERTVTLVTCQYPLVKDLEANGKVRFYLPIASNNI